MKNAFFSRNKRCIVYAVAVYVIVDDRREIDPGVYLRATPDSDATRIRYGFYLM